MADPKKGEWYWGAKCPQCGQMAAHSHDPARGKGAAQPKTETPGMARMQCPDGHTVNVAAQDLMRFEWGAQ
jgi:hypothetical protein